ncbi:hypothetical protein [Bradyrhizobium sp. USDA 10063]
MIARVDHDPREPSEHALQVQVLDVINVGKIHPDIFAFAIPNAGRRGFQTATKMKAEGLKAGIADVCIMMPESRTGWLELKTLRGRQSDHQKGFEARCIRLGHPYALARNLDEAITALRRMGVLKLSNY